MNTAWTAVEVSPKVPFLSSLGQEFLHEPTHIDRVSFLMPRDAFRDIAPVLDAACGSVLDAPLGHLLGEYMLALERHLPAVLGGQSLTKRAANSRPYRLARNLYMPRLEKVSPPAE
jgi:hypothetical protein